MAGPKKPGARIVLEAKLRIPKAFQGPKPTAAQLARLKRAFKSDILASLGLRSDVQLSRMVRQASRPPRPKP